MSIIKFIDDEYKIGIQYLISFCVNLLLRFAGVCCPDYLQNVGDTTTPSGELSNSTP